MWNDLTIDWNDLTWNDLTVERNDRKSLERSRRCPRNRGFTFSFRLPHWVMKNICFQRFIQYLN